MTYAEFHERTKVLELLFDLSVSGGRRTRKRNTDVGGHPFSWHMKDMAKDWVPDDWGIFDACFAACLKLGLELLDERGSSTGDHWHVEPG